MRPHVGQRWYNSINSGQWLIDCKEIPSGGNNHGSKPLPSYLMPAIPIPVAVKPHLCDLLLTLWIKSDELHRDIQWDVHFNHRVPTFHFHWLRRISGMQRVRWLCYHSNHMLEFRWKHFASSFSNVQKSQRCLSAFQRLLVMDSIFKKDSLGLSKIWKFNNCQEGSLEIFIVRGRQFTLAFGEWTSASAQLESSWCSE
jgi:hypothetical protein